LILLLDTEKKLKFAVEQANSYDEWLEAATAYDDKLGHTRWKAYDQSSQYDFVSIRQRLDELRSLRARHDHRGLLFTLNEGIHGNMGGMGKSLLYGRAMLGTKQLIIDYVDQIVEALELIASDEVVDITFEEKLDFFRRAHHCFGSSAFMMSGSGLLLFFHVGVVKALSEQGLLPNIISGASGGSIVGSLVCTRTDKELKKLLNPEYFAKLILSTPEIEEKANRMIPPLMEIEEIHAIVKRLIPDMTFKESFEKTGRILNISVAPSETHQTSRLLNSTTTPNVLIRQSVLASAAVPGIYPPVTLEARDSYGQRKAYLPSRKWVDGSVSDDMPTKRLARLYGVNHFIVSQTNPAVLPFVSDSLRPSGNRAIIRSTVARTGREWVNAAATIARKPLQRNPSLHRASNLFLSLLNQNYLGDINLVPRNRFPNPFTLLAYPSAEKISRMMKDGEKSAWGRMEMIRNQTKISRKLDAILRDYEEDFMNMHKDKIQVG
jgi:TAG lipase/steryl ester hydrolase/phospholipase A2/LPA acyltransferase